MATRYKRAMAPLDDKARARLWDGGGATAVIAVGSEGSTGKLEELVHAFYNDEMSIRGEKIEEEERPAAKWRQALELELKDDLAEPAVKWIRAKAEAAVGTAGLECEDVVRRRLVRLMQERGLDAGICKSQWHNTSGISACSHEYIDAVVGETRYMVEINLAGEFKIARPTEDYTELLRSLPKLFVGRPSTLEAVIRLMCSAAQESIKKAGMHVPPWRRTKYMHEKWFGDYRRYTDTFSSSDSIGRTAPTAYTANQRCRGATGSSKLVNSIFLRGM
ncbi:uncharacterized protein LOC110099029 [Dendrobium catenatum]|uniref:Uncharacterized protein n=1 Tax=Dendrobium catenatum TaxID=906689 RepID=A0A2I0VKU3_9ASPA|nr:uncharacterized protein LOC110099029 [Dendrobium catenatum]PKU64021.1 hypothetical protein MA16_Dca012607 [Dendrobium catenatum]